ncbi:MAG: hypothetical protein IV100_16040 [Myxococcales bacterium]|nr:hypothetical protein [Myxococcales bacterium]
MSTFHVRSIDLCQMSSIDRDPPHSVSMFGMLNEGRAVGLPAQIDRLTVMGLIERLSAGEAAEAGVVVRVLSPSGQEMASAESTVPFRPEIKRFRLRLVMDGLVLHEAGTYRFEMEVTPSDGPSRSATAFYDLTYSGPANASGA